MVQLRTLVSLAVVGLVAAAAGGTAGTAPGAATSGTDGAVGGGTHVSFATGTEEERLEGTARRAAFERDLARADSPREEAAVVARQLNDSEARLEGLRRRAEELADARENGSPDRTVYEVRLERVAASAREVDRTADTLERAAASLSDEQLSEAGTSRTAVRELGSDATRLRERLGDETTTDPDVRTYADLATLTERYNAEVDSRSSDRLGRELRGEVVNLRATTGDGTVTLSFRVDGDGRMTEVRAGSRADATLLMRTDADAVSRLARADDPVGAFRRAVSDGDVRLTGIGPANWIKWALVDLLA